MTDQPSKLLLFVKDFTGRGADCFYWFKNGQLNETNAEQVVSFPGMVVCHDFWIIRDVLFDKTQDLPKTIVDLDEFRMAISGNPEDRLSREKIDITGELSRYGASPEACSVYKKMFYKGVEFDAKVACEAAKAMEEMYSSLCAEALAKEELERFLTVELPIYRLLQKAMSAGIAINSTGLSEKRREAEHDYFFCLKNYSATHDLPLETPTWKVIETRLYEAGFDLSGISINYALEFLPHEDNFGNDTLTLLDLDSTRRVLSSLAISSGRTRPIIDVFGSRTSRVHLRSPSLQNIAKKYRTIVTAREGAELCYVDFDQYEVGIMAALSGDPELARLYGMGDMYDLFATTHLGLEGNRKAAKQLFLSYAYGMSREALIVAAVSLGVDRGRAKAAFKIFSKYEEWKKSVWTIFQREGRIGTIKGNYYKRDEVYGLKLISVSALKDIVDKGTSLVVVALVGEILHIRIFDDIGKRVIDKQESQLTVGDGFMELRQRLKPFPNESDLSLGKQQEIIKLATSAAGYTRKLSAKEQRSAVSQVVQGTASLIFKKALLEVSDLADVTIILPMHDALLFEHRLADTPGKVVAAFEKVMTENLEGRVKGKASISQFAPN